MVTCTGHIGIHEGADVRTKFSHIDGLERLSYVLEKVFAICFTDQYLARSKQSFHYSRQGNSSIAQSHYCINQMTSKRNADHFPESSMER